MREVKLSHILAISGLLAAMLCASGVPRADVAMMVEAKGTGEQNPPPPQPKKETKEEDPVPVTERVVPSRMIVDNPLQPDQFGTFFSPQINQDGDVAFIGRYIAPKSPGGGQGIFVKRTDGTWRIVRETERAKNLKEPFYAFGPFTVNRMGDFVFTAAFGGLSPLIASDNSAVSADAGKQMSQNRNSGLFLYDSNGLQNLLALGQEVPNMPSRFSSFSNPSINSQGTIAFVSAYVDPDGRGLFVRENGQLRIVARSGQKLAAGEKSVFSEHYYPSRINERGEIAFLARVGVGAGIFVARSSGIEMIALDGRPSPIRGATYLGFGNRTPSINDKGDVVYVGFYGGPRAGRGIFIKGAGPVRPVITTRDPNLKFAFTDFSHPDINNNGEIAFVARLEGTRSGIFIKTAKGLEAIAISGQIPPGMKEGEEFTNFAQTPSLNDKGEVVFYAQLKTSRVGIFHWSAKGGLRPFIMRGDPLPFKTEK